MKSLSEIDTTSKRASKAAGYSWGISEEVGKNIRLLEMFGLPGVKNLNDFYKKKKEQQFENLNLISKDNKTAKSEFCPIIAGTSFLDQIKSLENLNEIKFEKIAYPLLFLPFVSRASEVIGKTPRSLQGKGTDKKVIDRLTVALRSGMKFEGKAINYKKDGTPFIMYWRVLPIKVARKVKLWVAIQREGSVI